MIWLKAPRARVTHSPSRHPDKRVTFPTPWMISSLLAFDSLFIFTPLSLMRESGGQYEPALRNQVTLQT